MTTPTRRKRFVVDWRLQVRHLRFNLTYFAVFIVLFAGLTIAGPLSTLIGAAPADEQRAATRELLVLWSRLWPAALVTVILFAVHGLFVSHRIAGPLVRFRRVYRDIGQGDLSQRVATRQSDPLPSQAAALNDMTSELGRRVDGIKDQAATVEKAVECLRRVAETGPPEGVRIASLAAAAELEQLRAMLGQLRTPGQDATAQEALVEASSAW